MRTVILTANNDEIARYKTNIIPRIGEHVLLKNDNVFRVESVVHSTEVNDNIVLTGEIIET